MVSCPLPIEITLNGPAGQKRTRGFACIYELDHTDACSPDIETIKAAMEDMRAEMALKPWQLEILDAARHANPHFGVTIPVEDLEVNVHVEDPHGNIIG